MINLKKQIKLFTILKTKKISDAILKINDNKMKTVIPEKFCSDIVRIKNKVSLVILTFFNL